MDLNADFSSRVIVHSGDAPWVASPMAGVERRMLDPLAMTLPAQQRLYAMHRAARFLHIPTRAGRNLLSLAGPSKMNMATTQPAPMSAICRPPATPQDQLTAVLFS